MRYIIIFLQWFTGMAAANRAGKVANRAGKVANRAEVAH